MKKATSYSKSKLTHSFGLCIREAQFEEGYQLLSAGLSNVHAIVTTNATFQSDIFQSRLRARVSSFHHLLIADECHNLGAGKIQKSLPEEIQLRLGLSATPERHHDPEGTDALINYFGGIVFEYTLPQAIADGQLCNYKYHPHIVTLNEAETEEYAEITAKLSRMISGKDQDSEFGKAAMSLLIRRSRILASAQNKLEVLDQVISSLPERPKKAPFTAAMAEPPTLLVTRKSIRSRQSRLLGEKYGNKVRSFIFWEFLATEGNNVSKSLLSRQGHVSEPLIITRLSYPYHNKIVLTFISN